MAEPNAEFLRKLNESDAVRALRAERQLLEDLRKANWNGVQGAIYRDRESHKLREIDVVAHRMWQKRSRKQDYFVRITTVAEVKSAKGYSLVFSPCGGIDLHSLQRVWLGAHEICPRMYQATLRRCGLSGAQIRKLWKALGKEAAPNGIMIMADVCPDPPGQILMASSFQETNSCTTKDLDASVLWKASLAVSSAVVVLKQSALRLAGDWMIFAARVAHDSDEDVMSTALKEVHHCVRQMYFFHPVVVIESNMFAVQEGDIMSIQACRLVRLNQFGHAVGWVDVVASHQAKEYFKMITHAYDAHFEKLKWRPIH